MLRNTQCCDVWNVKRELHCEWHWKRNSKRAAQHALLPHGASNERASVHSRRWLSIMIMQSLAKLASLVGSGRVGSGSGRLLSTAVWFAT